MREDARGRHDGRFLPLSPEVIEARAKALRERIAAAVGCHAEIDCAAFLAPLRLRLDMSFPALEAAQSAMLQFGPAGYLEGSEPFRRLSEAPFVALVPPSAKHITTALAEAARSAGTASAPSV